MESHNIWIHLDSLRIASSFVPSLWFAPTCSCCIMFIVNFQIFFLPLISLSSLSISTNKVVNLNLNENAVLTATAAEVEPVSRMKVKRCSAAVHHRSYHALTLQLHTLLYKVAIFVVYVALAVAAATAVATSQRSSSLRSVLSMRAVKNCSLNHCRRFF